MDIATRLCSLRGNLTREEFAKRIGIHPQTLYSYEKGKKIPKLKTIEQICNRLKISKDWLISGIKAPSQSEETPDYNETKAILSVSCARCSKLEAKLEKIEEQREKLYEETVRLLKENAILREEIATLKERQRKGQASLFDESQKMSETRRKPSTSPELYP